MPIIRRPRYAVITAHNEIAISIGAILPHGQQSILNIAISGTRHMALTLLGKLFCVSMLDKRRMHAKASQEAEELQCSSSCMTF